MKDFTLLVLALPDISKKEKLDEFVDGLSPNLRMEVCQDPSMNFESAARLAVRMDLVFSRGNLNSWRRAMAEEMGPTPMEIGNVESRHGRKEPRFTADQLEDIKLH